MQKQKSRSRGWRQDSGEWDRDTARSRDQRHYTHRQGETAAPESDRHDSALSHHSNGTYPRRRQPHHGMNWTRFSFVFPDNMPLWKEVMCPCLKLYISGLIHTGRATQANRTYWCEWEYPHCTQATSEDLRSNLCARVQCELGLTCTSTHPRMYEFAKMRPPPLASLVRTRW